MKFTCDSCGAQYMIGDEKLGQRGVKVRCKKCSYVIILRPPGYQSSAKKAGPPAPPSGHDELDDGDRTFQESDRRGPPSQERPITLPEDAFAPTTPFTAPFAPASDVKTGPALPSDLLHETSSELGLSKDFAAMGFDDRAALRLNVGIDVGKISPGFPDNSSPFAMGRTGGSLAEPMRDHEDEDEGETVATADGPPTSRFVSPRDAVAQIAAQAAAEKRGLGALGASLPKLHDDDPHEPTSVENRTVENTISNDEEFGMDGTGESTAPGNHDQIDPRIALGDQKTIEEDAFEAKSVEERILAMDKNELQDMEHSLERALSTQENKKPGSRPRAPIRDDKDEVTDTELKKSPVKANAASLHALAQDAYGDARGSSRSVSFAQPQPKIIAGENGERHRVDQQLDAEIGGAFDAMFSPAMPPSQAYQDGGLQANTVQDAPAPDVFGMGFQDPEANKKPTRIFDISAMQQVQSEQDIASGGTNGHGRPAPLTTESAEWYVAINDEQVGPLGFDDVRERWEKEEISPSSLCWKAGMGDWSPIRSVKELEALGDMDDRVRTVVSRIEANEDSVPPPGAPPIAMPEERPEPEEPVAAEQEDSTDEPSWRPSAASALASLAAEELGDITLSKGERKSDVAIGRALPATSDALEKLLKGESSSSRPASASPLQASPFGAAEQSSSSIRPLPKRSEMVSSVSLRDPTGARSKPNYLLFAVIVGGFLFLGSITVAVAVIMRSPASGNPPQNTLATSAGTNPVAQVAAIPGTPVPATNPGTQAVPATNPGTAVTPNGAADPAKDPGLAAGAANPASAASAGTAAGTSPDKGVAAVGAGDPKKTQDGAPKTDDEETKKKRRGGGLRAASGTGGQGTGLGASPRRTKEDKKAAEPEKAAPAREDPPKNEEDDLLGAVPKKQKRIIPQEEPAGLPKQLEDSDILGVMRRNGEAIKGCLGKQKTADAAIEGVMTVNFVIEGNGQTKRWSVSPDKFKSAIVGKCVVDAVKTWKFPQFSGRPMPVDFPVRVRGK